MATFETIQTKVSSRLKDPNNVDISLSDVNAAINDALAFWSKRRFWFNTFQENVTLVENNPILPALTTNPNPIEIFATGGITINYSQTRWKVNKVTSDEYDQMNTEGRGIPFAFTYRAGQYELYWYPDRDYTAVVRGLKRYENLTTTNNTNDFTENADALLMYEALSRLYAEFRQDDKMESYYAAAADKEFKNLRKQTIKDNSSGRLSVEGF